jgi:peptidoglycan/LPS O-acetylase OafA/YrhL
VPRPAESTRRYVPGLDGIRALAVLCVIAYHLRFSWAQGGMLGVAVFFTLSGYLITDLLLTHWVKEGDLGLGQFWLRRARRLLPALFAMLAVVTVWVSLLDASQLTAVRRQVIAAAVYLSNWSTISQHGSYFARFATPLPLDHLWSLAIEEQFYLLWPFLLLLAIYLVRGRLALILLTLLAAGASALAMALLYHPGYDPTRVYEGTDTRAFGLLIGAALAMAWPTASIPAAASRPAVRDLLDLLGLLGLLTIALLVHLTSSFTPFLYPYGFLLLSVATAATLAAAVNPAGRLGVALGVRPLRWTGVRSYAIYLWQWPIIVLLSPLQGPISLPLAAGEIALTFLIAAISWRYLEDPIRHGALARLHRRLSARPRLAPRRRLAFPGVLASAGVLVLLGLSGLLPAASAGHRGLVGLSGPTGSAGLSGPTGFAGLASSGGARTGASGDLSPAGGGDVNGTTSSSVASGGGTSFKTGAPRAYARGRAGPPKTEVSPQKTSCQSVLYIGDSTSEGEISPEYIPDVRHRLQAQLWDVGVSHTIPEISGARSIVETFEDHPNAATVAAAHMSAGYHGCWILAMGTNDVADVETGSNVGLNQRIERMMTILHGLPVLWVNVITLLQSGEYREQAMRQWNRDLLAACSRYPNMRVFDWASLAKRPWFIPDGIHYYTPGYIARTHLIAHGLLHAFPADGPPSAGCLVG